MEFLTPQSTPRGNSVEETAVVGTTKLILPAPALRAVSVYHLQVHATVCQISKYKHCGRKVNPSSLMVPDAEARTP